MKRLYVGLSLLLLALYPLHAQEIMQPGSNNYTSFFAGPVDHDAEISALNPGNEAHPELGKLFPEAPCTDCFEVIAKRTETTKYFVKKGSEGKYIYQQSSTDPMHYMASGSWRTIFTKLRPDITPGNYHAREQAVPLEISTVNGQIALGSTGSRIFSSNQLELIFIDASGNETSLGFANWANHTAGDDGLWIYNAWAGIDLEVKAIRGGVKTSYWINQPMPQYAGGELVIRDHLQLEGGLNLITPVNNGFSGLLEFADASGNVLFLMSQAVAFESQNIKGSLQELDYRGSASALDIVVPGTWLTRPQQSYPVIIDPLLQGTNTMAINGSGYNAACFTGGCSYNLAVPVPPAITVTDIRWSFNYTANSGCWMSEGAVDFQLGNCRSPNLPNYFWFCNLPSAGNCLGNNISIFSHVQSCVPAPQCAGYNMNFTMRFYRCYGTGTGCQNYCIIAAAPWTMVVEGRTVEMTNISPPTTICQGQSATLTASGNYGVAPYTYTWNPGNVQGNPATVTPNQTTTYTLTLTDQCGNTANGTSTVNVIPNSNPGFTITPNPACAGQPVTITGGGAYSPAAYNWTAPSSNNPNVNGSQSFNTIYANPGTYSVTLNFQNGNCTFPSTQQVTVSPATVPSVSITANPNGPICSGIPVTFTATPTNGGNNPSYQWQVNGVNVGTNSTTYTNSNLQNGDVVTVIMTSNAPCAQPASVTSNAITIVVTLTVTPSVSITANPNGAICAGTSVTFTATPTNGGNNPSYQWQVNGVNVGSNSSTYTSNSLQNGATVSVIMTSNNPCAQPTTANSNVITMTVNPVVVPSVSITANPNGAICAGTSVTFTATPTNGGPNPTYQWQVNGANVGTNSTTYTNSNLQNGDVITVIMTSNAPCAQPASATSNAITMTVNPILVPSVSITANPNGPICAGTSVTFTATPTNGGSNPQYQWQVNGANVGTNSSTYTASNLTNGATVTVTLTSNAVCVQPATATSNTITMTVNPVVVPSVSITANPNGAICAGTPVTFTATPTNGGNNPSYQWQVNGVNVGTNSSTYTANNLTNGAVVTVTLTSNAICAQPATATSNAINMTVNPILTPSVSITANPGSSICPGIQVTFTATPTNGGNTPQYQWLLNGANVGTNSSTYSNNNLQNGDQVSVVLTSNALCVQPATATSNVITMVVGPPSNPSVSISAQPQGPVCQGTAITFTGTETDPGQNPTYQWLLNGQPVGNNSLQYTLNSPQNGDVITLGINYNDPCAVPAIVASNQITITVIPPVTPTVSITANPSGPVCPGTQVTFTANITNGGLAPQIQWTLNGQPAGNGGNTFSLTPQDNDQVSVTVTNTDPCATGPATSNVITLDVFDPLQLAVGGTSSVCPGDPVIFTATPSGGDANTYAITWQPQGSGNQVSFTATQSVTYTATVTDQCGTASGQVSVTVNNPPTANFNFDPLYPSLSTQPMNFYDLSQNAAQWQWGFGDGGASGEQNPEHTYVTSGDYEVVLIITSAEGCTDTVMHTVTVGDDLTIFIPNAFTPNLDMDNPDFKPIGQGLKTFQLEVYNRWGERIFLSSPKTPGWTGKIGNGGDAPIGVYSYRITAIFLNYKEKVYIGNVTLIR